MKTTLWVLSTSEDASRTGKRKYNPIFMLYRYGTCTVCRYIWDCIFSSRYIYDTAAWILACIGWIEKQTAQQEEGSSTFLVGTEIE